MTRELSKGWNLWRFFFHFFEVSGLFLGMKDKWVLDIRKEKIPPNLPFLFLRTFEEVNRN